MGMGSMSTVDMNMGGRDIAGDDMDMGGMHEETANKNKTFGERLVSWLGRVHTMVIHFPIALFIGAFGVALFGLWRRNRDYQPAAHIMLVVGALGAIVAALLGRSAERGVGEGGVSACRSLWGPSNYKN